VSGYFDNTGRIDRLSGGVRVIPITTPAGDYRVWTKRIGNNPSVKMLLLHGGPGLTHEYLEPFDSWLPAAGVEYYYYDQLGSAYSDQPEDQSLWTLPRFVDEVDQVRRALGLDRSNFVLFGHSWGGLLAIEYALTHPGQLKGMIVSSMMASASAYNEYATRVLMPQMDQDALTEIQRLETSGQTSDPRFDELIMKHFLVDHLLRLPPSEWPEPVLRSVSHMNGAIYNLLQGPSELGISGTMVDWDRSTDLAKITVPTLMIGATHDTMDPAHLEWMAAQLPNGRYHHCPNGSHFSFIDDQESYFAGLTDFLHQLDAPTAVASKGR
jgi:proline iminopeptidase